MVEVRTNIAQVVGGVLQSILGKFDGVNVTFTPDLTLEQGLADRYAWRLRSEDYDIGDLPCLFWNRQPLVVDEHLQERARDFTYQVDTGVADNLQIHQSVLGNLQLSFAYATRDMRDLEVFEVVYQTVVSPHTSFEMSFTGIEGAHVYECLWEDLDTLEVRRDNTPHMLMFFTAKLTGWFHVFSADHPLLKIIDQDYFDYYKTRDSLFIENVEHVENP